MKGFTLIELLIVIGIIGVLAAVVLVGIDPVDKINAANDSKVQRDINALANAMESYAANSNGTYVTLQSSLVTHGDLKVALTAPGGYITYGLSGGAQAATVYGQLKSKKYTSANTPTFVWCSNSGRAGATASSTTCP